MTTGFSAEELEAGLQEWQSWDQTSDAAGEPHRAQPVSSLPNCTLTHTSFSSRREGAASSLVLDQLELYNYCWYLERSPHPGS